MTAKPITTRISCPCGWTYTGTAPAPASKERWDALFKQVEAEVYAKAHAHLASLVCPLGILRKGKART